MSNGLPKEAVAAAASDLVNTFCTNSRHELRGEPPRPQNILEMETKMITMQHLSRANRFVDMTQNIYCVYVLSIFMPQTVYRDLVRENTTPRTDADTALHLAQDSPNSTNRFFIGVIHIHEQ